MASLIYIKTKTVFGFSETSHPVKNSPPLEGRVFRKEKDGPV